MKYLKTFEKQNISIDDIKIGDYVYAEEDSYESSKLLKDFTKNNICRVVDKDDKQICVAFNIEPPERIKRRFDIIRKKYSRWLTVPDNIIEFAPTIKDLKIKSLLKNYNL